MSTSTEKMGTAIFALIILLLALALLSAGSFLPEWVSTRNTTAEGNVTYSLWMRQECFGIICSTDHVRVQWTNEDCWQDKHSGKEVCKKTRGYKLRADTTCRVANYCNMTWISQEDMDSVPSLLYVAKAFETPAMGSALMTIVLYVVKICLLAQRPNARRLHLRAAYLTFGAVAGFAAVVGIIIFCVMLDKDTYRLHWAPYLNCAGGALYIFFGVGGYLNWRNHAADDLDPEEGEFVKTFPEAKPNGPFFDRQISRTFITASEAQV